MASKVCVVFGAGEKLGYSLVRKYASHGFKVVASRRKNISEDDLKSLGAGVTSIPCDVTKEEDIHLLVKKVEAELGPIHTVIYNAGTGVWKNWDKATLAELDMSFSTNTRGLLAVAQAVCPGMVERGEGVLAVTGATASLRGKPFTSVFAPAKGAQRLLTQALARDLGPKGVHVFLTIIDGQMNNSGEDKHMNTDAVAETYWNLANQHKSAWSFEIDLRPHVENW